MPLGLREKLRRRISGLSFRRSGSSPGVEDEADGEAGPSKRTVEGEEGGVGGVDPEVLASLPIGAELDDYVEVEVEVGDDEHESKSDSGSGSKSWCSTLSRSSNEYPRHDRSIRSSNSKRSSNSIHPSNSKRPSTSNHSSTNSDSSANSFDSIDTISDRSCFNRKHDSDNDPSPDNNKPRNKDEIEETNDGSSSLTRKAQETNRRTRKLLKYAKWIRLRREKDTEGEGEGANLDKSVLALERKMARQEQKLNELYDK